MLFWTELKQLSGVLKT